ncbi:MAG TPA: hypothetical protein DIU15_21250, partial [Deltaproteobacteria bacterium]|nr:hypothetical protein [Deltaproteobacteria bacterium]
DNDCDGLIDEVAGTDCDFSETEPNDTAILADTISGNGLVCGTINSDTQPTDSDYYEVSLGDWTYLTLDIDTTGSSSLDTFLSLYDDT